MKYPIDAECSCGKKYTYYSDDRFRCVECGSMVLPWVGMYVTESVKTLMDLKRLAEMHI